MVGFKYFLPRLTKKFPFQNRKKTEGGRKCPCIIVHGLHPCCFSLHFFFFLFSSLPWTLPASFLFLFFFSFLAGLSSILFFFGLDDVIFYFFYGRDFKNK